MELRRRLLMQMAGGGGGGDPIDTHLKGIYMDGTQYFPLDYMTGLNGDYAVEWQITDSSKLSPVVFGGINFPTPSGSDFGIWAYNTTYNPRLINPFPFSGIPATANDMMKITVTGNNNDGNFLYMYKNGTMIYSVTNGQRLSTITDEIQFAVGAFAVQNDSYTKAAGREFVGNFFGIKDGNGAYIVEPVISNGVTGLYIHAAGKFVAPVGGAVTPIYFT